MQSPKEIYLQEKAQVITQLEQLNAEKRNTLPGTVEYLAIETGIAFLRTEYARLQNKLQELSIEGN